MELFQLSDKLLQYYIACVQVILILPQQARTLILAIGYAIEKAKVKGEKNCM
jgi:hypothetical protein